MKKMYICGDKQSTVQVIMPVRSGRFLCLVATCIWFCTPVQMVNATAASSMFVNGKGRTFFISAAQAFLNGMTSHDEKCLHGIHVSHPNRCTHETGKSISSPTSYCFRPEPAGCQAANDAYAFIVYYGLLDRYHSFLSHRHALPWKSRRFRHLLLKNNRQAIRLLLDVFLEEDFPVPGTSPWRRSFVLANRKVKK